MNSGADQAMYQTNSANCGIIDEFDFTKFEDVSHWWRQKIKASGRLSLLNIDCENHLFSIRNDKKQINFWVQFTQDSVKKWVPLNQGIIGIDEPRRREVNIH